jgi:hypothetical protein
MAHGPPYLRFREFLSRAVALLLIAPPTTDLDIGKVVFDRGMR